MLKVMIYCLKKMTDLTAFWMFERFFQCARALRIQCWNVEISELRIYRKSESVNVLYKWLMVNFW